MGGGTGGRAIAAGQATIAWQGDSAGSPFGALCVWSALAWAIIGQSGGQGSQGPVAARTGVPPITSMIAATNAAKADNLGRTASLYCGANIALDGTGSKRWLSVSGPICGVSAGRDLAPGRR